VQGPRLSHGGELLNQLFRKTMPEFRAGHKSVDRARLLAAAGITRGLVGVMHRAKDVEAADVAPVPVVTP
jgi:hypothetical protein